MLKIVKWILVFTFLTPLYATESNYTPYVLRQGDTISELLHDYKFFPLYGKQRWVEKVLRLNRLTWTEAKLLKPGDVIVIPKKSLLFDEQEIHSLQASWKREIAAKLQQQQSSNINIWASYGKKDLKFDQEQVNVGQVVKVILGYQADQVDLSSLMNYTPYVTVAIYTQTSVEFAGHSNLFAEFTPSYQLNFGTHISLFKQQVNNLFLTPQVEYEYFSAMTFDGASFSVRKQSLVWGGMGVSKQLWSGKQVSITGSAVGMLGSQFSASKANIGVRMDMQMLSVKAVVEYKTLTIKQRMNSTMAAISVGHSF